MDENKTTAIPEEEQGGLVNGAEEQEKDIHEAPEPPKPPEAPEEEQDSEEKCDGGEKTEMPFTTFLPKGSGVWVKKPIQVRAVRMETPFRVETLEGELIGNAGDYLIEGIEGELYPCKPQIFCATYDKA